MLAEIGPIIFVWSKFEIMASLVFSERDELVGRQPGVTLPALQSLLSYYLCVCVCHNILVEVRE